MALFRFSRERFVNYVNTFIAVAPDSAATLGSVPPERGGKKSIAVLEHALIVGAPYGYTQEEVQFAVHVRRAGLSHRELELRRAELWRDFFAKPMACMRTSPLPKSYGWGLHFNEAGKVALVGVESPAYQRLAHDSTIAQTRAMRNKKA